MNKYTKFQKILSFGLIISIFLNMVIWVPDFRFFDTSSARDIDRYDIVAIIVQEDLYRWWILNSWIRESVDKYARNIQSVLPDTKTMIIPTPRDTHPFNISSLLEKLYFEWYKWMQWMPSKEDSSLVWAVFVWDIPLPIVHNASDSQKTVLPYVDFVNKLYIFNHESGKFEYDSSNNSNPSAEIWHGFISPNTWNTSSDIRLINDYFTKNNDFYSSQWLFENSYEPYVFYYDQVREEKAVRYVDYIWYNSRIDNIEDITYNRFTKFLAKKLEDSRNDALWDDLQWLDSLLPEGVSTTNSVVDDTIPDIHTKSIIEASSKRYLEIFNPDTSLWEFRKNVYNAWRYTNLPNVSVDMVPQLLEYMDETSFNHIKTVNTDLENYIDDIVMNWLSRQIPILQEITRDQYLKYYDVVLKNYYTWQAWENIESANQCSIFRWFPKMQDNTSQLVEANKWYNLWNEEVIKNDIDILTENINIKRPLVNTTDDIHFNQVITCFDENVNPISQRIFGNNTVLNLKRQWQESDYNIDLVEANLSDNLQDPIPDSERKEMFEETIREEEQDIALLESLKLIIENRLENIKRLYNSIEEISYLDVSLDDNQPPTEQNSPYATQNERKCTNLFYDWNTCTPWFNRIKIPFSIDSPEVLRTKREQYNGIRSSLQNLIQSQKNLLRDNNSFRDIISNSDSLICDEYPDWNYDEFEKYVCDNRSNHTNNMASIEALLNNFNNIIINAKKELDDTKKIFQDFLEESQVDAISLDWEYLDEWEDPYTFAQKNRYDRFVYPIFDVSWSKALPYDSNNEQYIPSDIIPSNIFAQWETYSPMDCLVNDIIINNYFYDKSTPRKKTADRRGTKNMNANLWCDNPSYELVLESTRDRKRRRSRSRRHRVKFDFTCQYVYNSCLAPIDNSALPLNPFYDFDKTFFDIYDWSNSLELEYEGWTMHYNSIPSYIMHKSPTFEEIRLQQQSMITPSLPVDSDRYVDFVSAIWEYVKYIYPNLFRLKNLDLNDLDYSYIDNVIKEYLDEKSRDFNEIIRGNNPSDLSWVERELYELFKDGDFPNIEVDFYNLLKEKSNITLTIWWDTKNVNYYDQLVLSVFWHNLNSVPAKYKYIFEHFLSDQFLKDNSDYDFFLPRNKQQYEMAYIWAPWDARNMYISLDPEKKADNPYSWVFASNALLSNLMSAPNASEGILNTTWGNFKCAPPEGVPLWEWFDAVKCRLDDLEIGIFPWRCSWNQLLDFDNQCSSKWDIPSCEEDKLSNWKPFIEVKSSRFWFNSIGDISLYIVSDDKPIWLSESFWVDLNIIKLESLGEIIYDRDNASLSTQENKEKIQDYISFNSWNYPLTNWKASASFSTKYKNAKITFEASYEINWEIKKSLLEIEITDWWMSSLLYWLSNSRLSPGDASIYASQENSIFLVDSRQFSSLSSDVDYLSGYSDSINKLFISITNSYQDNKIDLNFPISIDILKDWRKVRETQVLSSLDWITAIWGISLEWRYEIKITDASWDTVFNTINILPTHLSDININLWTHILETGWVYTTNFIDLRDNFWNLAWFSPFYIDSNGVPVWWMPYNVIVEINWNWITFEDGTRKKELSSPDWLIPFRLKSTNNSWAAQISFKVDWLNLSKTANVVTTDKVEFEINIMSDDIEVWYNEYEYEIIAKTNLIRWVNELIPFTSRAYFRSDNIYLEGIEPFINIQNSRWKWSFKTKTKAKNWVNFELIVEWVREPIVLEWWIDIKASTPIKLDYFLTKPNLQANNDDSSNLIVSILDYFWNVVDIDTTVEIEVLEKYKSIIKIEDKTLDLIWWRWVARINSTNIPWIAYFKIKSEIDLARNFVTLPWQNPFLKVRLNSYSFLRNNWSLTEIWEAFFYDFDNINYQFIQSSKDELISNSVFQSLNDEQKEVVLNIFDANNGIKVYWVWENAWKIQSSYFLNNINSYNALYTTLIWWPFWDITTPSYLAWNLLFDKNNRALAVTSLLNDLKPSNKILSLNNNLSILKWGYYNHITQDIITNTKSTSKWLKISLFNNLFWDIISDIYLNFVWTWMDVSFCSDNNLDNCLWWNSVKLSLEDKSYNIVNHERSDLSITDANNNQLFTIKRNWEILFIHPSIEFNLNFSWKKWIILDLNFNGSLLAKLWVSFSDSNMISYGYFQWDDILSSLNKWVFINILSNNYWVSKNYNWVSSLDDIWFDIVYVDPFGLEEWLGNNVFLQDFQHWYEFFAEEAWLWWEWQNKIKLWVAAWKTVWQATKDYMSFSLINLWDPVFSLVSRQKKLPWTQEDRKFDSWIWYKISSDSNNISFQVFDYNNDWIDDVVILKSNWYIQLLEWTNDLRRFIDRGNLLYFSDFWWDAVLHTWDFSWNWYDDILVLNKDRKPILYHNENKKFSRINLDLDLEWELVQIISFKMDVSSSRSWWYDIVTLDDNWDIKIHFWTDEPWVFSTKLIWGWLWVQLNEEVRKDLGIVYFSWLYQIPTDDQKRLNDISSSEDLLSTMEANIQALESWDISLDDMDFWGDFNDWIFERLIFDQVMYWNQRELILDENNMPVIPEDTPSPTTFIKSKYSQAQWLSVTQQFKNITHSQWVLRSNDEVSFEINVKNESSSLIEDIAYISDIPLPFVIDKDKDLEFVIWWETFSLDKSFIKKSPDNRYDFLIDEIETDLWKMPISLQPWEEITFKLFLKTLPFTYWNIQAWYFKTAQDWWNNNWDIIFKSSSANCWDDYDVYYSFWPLPLRQYRASKKELTCNWDKPEELDVDSYLDLIDIFSNWDIDPDSPSVINAMEKIDDLLNTFKESVENKPSNSIWDSIKNANDSSFSLSNLEDNLVNIEERFSWAFESIDDKILDWLWFDNMDDALWAIDDLIDGFWCWFWWGSCINSPLNWAPLAPWSSPTLFGMPIVPSMMTPFSWLPVFSALTNFLPTPAGPVPFIWPPIPWMAGWRLWPANWPIRIFVTPTLTWAIWTAICFGPSASWFIPPPWVSPVTPWGNCIVAAMPFFWCWDWWWDIDERLIPSFKSWDWSFWVINSNCDISNSESGEEPYLWVSTASDYISYAKDPVSNISFRDRLKDSLNTVAWPWWTWETSDRPLVSIWWSGEPVELSVDFKALVDWNFKDIVKLQMNRVSAFPDFLMWWVTSQIEEIVTKLTDWPTIFVILPDFTWVFDVDFNATMKEADIEISNRRNKNEELMDSLRREISSLEQQESQICNNPTNSQERASCARIRTQLTSKAFELAELELNTITIGNSSFDWFKRVFEFVSRLPIISFNIEKFYFDIPLLDFGSIFKAQIEFERALNQRRDELDRAKKSWTYWWACDENSQDYENCIREHWHGAIIDAQNLIESLEKNIEILEKWKKLPEDINDLIRIRETRLEQLVCNFETMLEVWVVWISENGKIFRAWVDLYITVKAILKSWQLLVDVFIDFEAECKSCKNERHDLMSFIWKLISFIIPSIPIIQFPKWPDIWLDLHNINVWIEVWFPEFEMNLRPIDIPVRLPDLYLPDAPTISLTLPSLPLLPEPNLPTLPDIPTLPEIKLPDLPPPPMLPRIFAQLEWVLEILKLVTKIMCILKTSPFVPEWRAGDLIAFITERWGTLPTDFLDIDISWINNFSYPFIDAIRVTTYVEFIMWNNQLLDIVWRASDSWNQKVYEVESEFKDNFNFSIQDIDLRKYAIPDLDLWWEWPEKEEGEKRLDSWFRMIREQYSDWEKEAINNRDSFREDILRQDLWEDNDKTSHMNILDLARALALWIWNFHKNISDNSREVSMQDFKLSMASEISKDFLHSDYRYKDILNTFSEPLRYNYVEEDRFIQELLDFNNSKFGEVIDILRDEIDKWRELREQININWFDYFYESQNLLLSDNTSWLQEIYNSRMSKYNEISKESILSFLTPDDNTKSEIQILWEELINKVNSSINSSSTNQLNLSTWWSQSSSSAWSCKMQDSAFIYEWIYVSENDSNGTSRSYRLFDYTDELNWDELLFEYWDGHIAYMVWWDIYIKENLSKQKNGNVFFRGNPLILNNRDNIFYSQDNNISWTNLTFIESVNWFRESLVEWNFINLSFKQPTNPNITNFRIEFFDIVDKFSDKFAWYISSYIPSNTKKYIIDAFAGINNITRLPKSNESEKFYKSNNLVVVENLTADSLDGVHLRKVELQPLWYQTISNRDDLPLDIKRWEKLYSSSNYSKIEYYKWDNFSDINTKELSYKEYFSPSSDIRIINIEWRLNRYVWLWNSWFVVNPWRRLYTWKDWVSIIYYLKSEENLESRQRRVSLSKHQNIEFEEPAVIQFIEGWELSVSTSNFIDLYWREILVSKDSVLLPWSKINIWRNNGWIDLKYYDQTTYSIDFSKVKYYEVYNLWFVRWWNQDYSFRTNIEKDFYYAKIKPFSSQIWGTYSNQILLSPQVESDKTSPEIAPIRDFRVPINLQRRLDVTNFINENLWLRNIKNIWVDFDLETDTTWDWILDNDVDFEMIVKNDLFDIEVNTEIWAIFFDIWPFDTTFKRDLKLYVEDNNWNIWSRVLQFEVYAPDLEISQYLEENWVWILKWKVDWNKYVWSLVDIYRIRWWNVKLTPLESLRAVDNWLFQLNDLDITKWLNVTRNNGEKITYFEIDEETWKINSLNPAFNITVYPSNHLRNEFAYPKITINRWWQEIYYQYLVVPDVWRVNIVDDFNNNKEIGVYYLHWSSDYKYHKNPIWVENSWDVLIYRDENWNILSQIKIFKDWRIELPQWYSLEYVIQNLIDNVILRIKNEETWLTIWRLMIVPDKHYIME